MIRISHGYVPNSQNHEKKHQHVIIKFLESFQSDYSTLASHVQLNINVIILVSSLNV